MEISLNPGAKSRSRQDVAFVITSPSFRKEENMLIFTEKWKHLNFPHEWLKFSLLDHLVGGRLLLSGYLAEHFLHVTPFNSGTSPVIWQRRTQHSER